MPHRVNAMVPPRARTRGVVFAALAALSLVGSAAHAQTPSWCGPKKIKLALLDGAAGESWRRIAAASGKDEAAKCPSVASVAYADAQGDTQKAIADIESAASQVDALVVYGDAGPALLPPLKAAYQAGKVVVPYRIAVGGEDGKTYTKFVGGSFKDAGAKWGAFLKSVLPDGGNLVFLGGRAGGAQGAEELQGLKSVLGLQYKFVNPSPYDPTNWDPDVAQQAVTTEIAKTPKIDAVVADFGPSLLAALPVFKSSGSSIPALATTDGNGLGCFWTKSHADNPNFRMFTIPTGVDVVRLAVRWAVAAATGGALPRDDGSKTEAFENSVTEKPRPVQCRKDLPADIFLSAQMSPEEQAKIAAK